jgi:hypothetical protein
MSRLRELAWISGLRGTDGTGICQGLATKKNLKITLEKAHHDVTYFLWFHDNHKDGNDKILRDYSCNFIIGHVRAATRGNVTDANAHPFDTGRYISAHNGTLHDKKYQHSAKTDSEMMFEDVENRGLYSVLRDLESSSAYSIVSFDKTSRELSFATNGKRPLVYAYLNHRRVFFWASEKRQLDFILAGVQDKSDVFKFTEDMIYTFRPDDVNAGKAPAWSIRKIKKPVEVTLLGDSLLKGRHPTGPSSPVRPPVVTQTQNQTNIIRIADTGKYPIANLISSKKDEHERIERAKKLICKCVHCQRDMDLLAQYEGVEVDVGLYVCKDCDDLMNELQTKQNRLH